MTRLTSRNPDGAANFADAEFESVCAKLTPANREKVREIVEKLAEHEDAEQERRLVMLPCKAGDPIFSRYNWCVPIKTHKRSEILIGEYIVLLTGMMYTREGTVTPFVCFGNGWGGICYEKPLDEVLEKCAFTLDGAFEQAKAALNGGEPK